MKGFATYLFSGLLTLTTWVSFGEDHVPNDLTKLSLEELMHVEVTSVSRTPEKLSASPAAVTVLTEEDIRRSGVTSIPEALRLVPGLEVARVDTHEWAISSRGFNDLFANKLLVMMDGRSIYTPLYSGVFWEEQDTMLEDIDRIEVVRGPGATLWGANAVNGVINIITKSARDTQGFLFSGGGGTEELGFGSVRYGGTLREDLFLRVYAKYFNRDDSKLANGSKADDAWQAGRMGFRMDWEPSTENALTFQGDIYTSTVDQRTLVPIVAPPFLKSFVEDGELGGGNLLGRWQHTFTEDSQMSLQAYYDNTSRSFSGFEQKRDTEDIDFHHWFKLAGRQKIIWGGGFRRTADTILGSPTAVFAPGHRASELVSGFIQDEIGLIEERVSLTIGTKVEHNDFTGFEVQPSARLLWTPTERQSIWGAVSRAVRTPSRAEDDIILNPPGIPPGSASITGSRAFDSEKMIAYEIGYRLQPVARWSLDATGFYNDYDDLRSFEPVSLSPVGPAVISNGLKGETYGFEMGAAFQAAEQWRLSAGYTFLQAQIHRKAGAFDSVTEASYEKTSPEHQVFLRSSVDLGKHVEFDSTLRYVDNIVVSGTLVPSYYTMDLRLAWKPNKNWEFAIVGQNLLDPQHPEFVPTLSATQRTEVERSVYAKVTCRF